MRYFLKVSSDPKNPLFEFCLQSELFLRVLLLWASRARTSDNKYLGLKKGDFFFSSTETKLFGLTSKQHGKLERIIKSGIAFLVIQKQGVQQEPPHGIIYRFINNEMVEAIGGQQEAEQEANRKQTGSRQEQIENGSKNVKKEKNNNKKENEDKPKDIQIPNTNQKPDLSKSFMSRLSLHQNRDIYRSVLYE